MSKRLVVVRPSGDLLKSHVKGYSRKDGTYVQEHDDKRQKKAAAPAGGGGYSHPHVVGKATVIDPHATGPKDTSGIQFAGTEYWSTGKKGKSFHDETPVREFESEDGHRVWLDDHGRVHADDISEVDRLRKKGEAVAEKPAAPAGGEGKAKETPNVVASKADVINATLGQHDAAAGFISVPPGKGQSKVEDFVEKVKSLGFSLAEGTTYDVNGDSVQLSKNEQGKAVLEDPDGNRAIIMATDGGDRVRISVSYQPAAKTGDKAAGAPKATSGAPKPASAAGGGDKRSHAQKTQDAEDASYSGESEKEDYGVYHKPGSKVRDNRGNEHEVVRHRGPTVTTKGGKEFHPTKLTPVGGSKPAAKPKAQPKPKETGDEAGWAALKDHAMFSQSDLDYFKGKGYSPAEVKDIWDRDHAAGHKPVVHKQAPDVVGVAADPDHYKKKGQGDLFKSIAAGVRLVLGRGK